MRYESTENTYIIFNFPSASSVSIDVYDLTDDTKVIDGQSMAEIDSTGIWKYLFTPTSTTKKDYLAIASGGGATNFSKIVFGGTFDNVLKSDEFITLK